MLRKNPRKITEIVQPNLRIRESLRRRIEQAARQNDVSLNREMVDRLEASFQQDGLRSIEQLIARLQQRVPA